MATRIALLHPGEMGVTVGAAVQAGGNRVGWVTAGRSDTTQRRAVQAGFSAYATLDELLADTDCVISVCPPAAAIATANAVAATGFHGIYCDANAVSPATARTVAAKVEAGGATYVDGGIIGPPVHASGTTRFYLSGTDAQKVAACFAASPLEAIDIGPAATAASALKMSYAAWTKGSAALLLAVRALARAEGVEDALRAEWNMSLPDLDARSESIAARNASKAWRFVGEMDEIARTFEAHNLPGGYHRAAAQTYASLSAYKDAAFAPTLEQALESMLRHATETDMSG
jgi:3-hydroxyisobutyrate dehydrogenase-like beta-hydroxyacid dehydrogenase